MLLKRTQTEQKSRIEEPAESERVQRISKEFSQLCEAIDKWKTDVIRWMFIFAVAEIVIVVGVVLLFFER